MSLGSSIPSLKSEAQKKHGMLVQCLLNHHWAVALQQIDQGASLWPKDLTEDGQIWSAVIESDTRSSEEKVAALNWLVAQGANPKGAGAQGLLLVAIKNQPLAVLDWLADHTPFQMAQAGDFERAGWIQGALRRPDPEGLIWLAQHGLQAVVSPASEHMKTRQAVGEGLITAVQHHGVRGVAHLRVLKEWGVHTDWMETVPLMGDRRARPLLQCLMLPVPAPELPSEEIKDTVVAFDQAWDLCVAMGASPTAQGLFQGETVTPSAVLARSYWGSAIEALHRANQAQKHRPRQSRLRPRA
jgi:hypothetical protein